MTNSEHAASRTLSPEEGQDELLSAYLDDELGADDRLAVEQRLSDDAQFRARLVELERAWEALDELPLATPSHSFTRSTMELAVSELTQDLKSRRPWWHAWLAPIALYLILPLALLSGAYAITYSIRMEPYRQLVRDLELIENFEEYDRIGCDLEFLEMLDSHGFFAGVDSHEAT